MKLENVSNNWVKQFEKPLVIAGPCSAESEDQIMRIAEQIDPSYSQIFRAGIWKPRTKPGNFEGVGAIGLKWLQRVKNEIGIPVATEVANAEHVRLAQEHEIDYLWIGARSTVNPFTVQEIAEALKGTETPVFVKNPLNPDLDLWIGAMERLIQMDVKKIGAIHRGFSTYKKTKYRNIPQWQIPIELKQKYPNLPLLSDPSHIGGRRNLIQPIAQQAFDFQFDGLMVEVHDHPDEAWSDAKQQITPKKLYEILKDIELREIDKDNNSYHDQLTILRQQIDGIDEEIWSLFEERMQIAENVGKLKKEYNVSAYQPDRWKEMMTKARSEKISGKLSEDFVDRVLKAIHQQSIDIQNQVIHNGK